MEIENFCKLTGYNVSPAEFVYIKESYEESGITNSTDFCAQWLIDRANGFWKKEMKLREKLANAKQELADATADKVIVENKLAEQTEQMDRYKDEVAKLTDATNRAAETIQSLLDTKNRLTAELESAKTDAVKATEAVDELNTHIAELDRRLNAVITAADEQTVEFNKLKAEYEALTQHTEDGVASTDIDELKHELTAAKTELDTVKAELIEQQYSIEDYKSLLFSINKLSKI